MTTFRHRLSLAIAKLPVLLPRSWRRVVLAGRPAAVARKIFLSLAGRETTAVVKLGRPLQGCRMRINLKMQKAYMYGTYEPAATGFIAAAVRDGWVVFDVGANIGYTALLMGKRTPAGQVYAFEPLPQNFACLCENVALNKMRNVRCEAKGLSDSAGQVKFHFRAEALTAGGSLLTNRPVGIAESVNALEVDTVAGDDYIAARGIGRLDFIKIDVEGAEGLVLKGLRAALRRWHPLILVELHAFEGSTVAQVRPLLEEQGYALTGIDASHLVATPRS